MATFYRVKVETKNARGEVLKYYTFDNVLFSLANRKYKQALMAAKMSGAAIVVASMVRMNNGCKIDVCYFIRDNSAMSVNSVSDNAQTLLSCA